MDNRIQKLARLLRDPDLAHELVQAGLDTPRKIKAIAKKDLGKLIEKGKVDKVLNRFQKGKDK